VKQRQSYSQPVATATGFSYTEIAMQLDITKEWFEKRAAMEGDSEIGAGIDLRSYPPAYGDCRCACHHSPMMHIVACCSPSESDFECMDADIRKYLGKETTQDIVDEVSRRFAERIKDIMAPKKPKNLRERMARGAANSVRNLRDR
jgi:hypothetical protein